MNDPIALLYVKPIGQIAEGEFKGNYYYMSHFQDTRLYRHIPEEEKIEENIKVGYGQFQMVCNGFQEIKDFMAKIQDQELFDALDHNLASFKKFDEVNSLKEQSRQRKMQTLYR